MGTVSRRAVIAGGVAAGGAVVGGAAVPALGGSAVAAQSPVEPLVTVLREDPRHPGLSRGQNQRFASDPECVYLPTTTAQVVTAVQRAVHAGRKVTVRSGGHCYEDFVDAPDTEVIVDMSGMSGVTFDAGRTAFQVEAGARLGDVYSTLFKRWGVTLPGGSCHTVGAGGHVPGAGYGQLSRAFGVIVDHLYAVEVVVVDSTGTARAVVATREAGDPNRELWWAHTGGGGGSFGIATRFWFRSPGATGTDPSALLPAPPAEVWIHRVEWSWEGLTKARFTRLLRNYGTWHTRNSGADSPYTGLFARLELSTRVSAPIHMVVQVDATRPDARALLDSFLAEVRAGVDVATTVTDDRKLPWLHSTGWQGLWVSSPTDRYKYKSSYHRRGFTTSQIEAFWEQLAETRYAHLGFAVSIASYGGRVNTVASDATADPHRDSVLKLLWGTTWSEAAEDASHLPWHQTFYRAVYADTGGVPVTNADTDGCFINYADIDLGDPRWNTSGVAWHQLYFKDSYPRLQRAKARFDPREVFRHAQSIRLPG
ncbi:FAD-binding oxidoreductase [Actinokineospora globicatena]|uniref:FAD-binding oxidoreductase n=1 Tax=Actinokineospora globicatena TaxID=103729 RepID=UPI0020A4F178|nr:FAD-binding oxidoreductase [Actinokineospora globicatena]MCP2306124.1 FAD/FMN-containing dehydrogenase [Actinokineospora globicatena]GLW80001.1 FAD-linked oxidase [Actinokineospora globicatena]GLW86830.1 FAD-linked oxidase [Actinokineospora globicatena]